MDTVDILEALEVSYLVKGDESTFVHLFFVDVDFELWLVVFYRLGTRWHVLSLLFDDALDMRW